MSVALESPGSQAPESLPFRIAHGAETFMANAALLAMALLPTLEVLSRNLRGTGLPSTATITQHLTLWIGFVGALLCARGNKHLSLSTTELLPEGKWRDVARFFSGTIAALVTALLGYASYKLVVAETQSGKTLVGSIPEWVSFAVMPVTLMLMAIRTAWNSAHRRGLQIASLVITLPVVLFMFWEHSNPVGAKAFLAQFDAGAEAWKWRLVSLVLIALLAGAPIYVAMAGTAMALFFADGTPIASVPTETLRLVISPTLPAIPLLTAAGYVLAEGGSARRLVRAYRAWFGWVPGGLAVMTCLICAFFTTLTGGSGVTILALGGLVYPILIEEKYPEGFSLGLVTASGSLGLLFFPSLPVILYGVVAQIADINQLFVAGLVPGLLMIGMVCAWGIWVGRVAPRTTFVRKEAIDSLIALKWEMGLPVFLLLPFLLRMATLVECAGLTCVYALFTQVFMTRDIPLKDLPGSLSRAVTLVGSVVIVLGVALGLTSYLVDAEIPALVIAWVKAHIETQFAFLLTLNVMLLVLGSVLEIYSAIVILAPLVAPLGESYGVDKIHLAIVFLANLELGFLFPPVGLNLFLSSSRFNKPLPQLYRNSAPFLGIMAISVMLITYVPAMTTGVVQFFYPEYVTTGH